MRVPPWKSLGLCLRVTNKGKNRFGKVSNKAKAKDLHPQEILGAEPSQCLGKDPSKDLGGDPPDPPLTVCIKGDAPMPNKVFVYHLCDKALV